MKYRWTFKDAPLPESVARLSDELNQLPAALSTSLILRGIDSLDSARKYFRPSTDFLYDPFLMKGMEEAVQRIQEAVENGERILVYGDYDVDGTTSVALMSSFLTSLGVSTQYFIPNRIEHGYGLCNAGIDTASDFGASLIIALDCGITAVEEAEYAKSSGIDLIICDHHTPPATLPEATAILNPKRSDCDYPFKELSACGVGFKLQQAVASRMGLANEAGLANLDLVALSIGADIVPVEDENRVLMSLGIDRIQSGAREGIRQLALVAGLNTSECSTSQIVFGFAPRINAAGRVESADTAVDLLLASSKEEARIKANVLEELNDRRRSLDQATLDQATKSAERMLLSKERHGLVLFDDRWHPGVIGITASRIVEKYYRPAILLTVVDGVAKGSARSIQGVNVYDVLEECKDLLIQFGGHDYAAGMSLEIDAVDAFRDRFNEEVGKRVTADLLIPSIRIDTSLDPSEISKRFWAVLQQFEPFGPGNSRPIYLSRGLQVLGKPRVMGREQNHIKFRVRSTEDARSRPFDVVGFNMAGQENLLIESFSEGRTIDLLFSIDENNWRGTKTLQLRARDLRRSAEEPVTHPAPETNVNSSAVA